MSSNKYILSGLLVATSLSGWGQQQVERQKKNVLFIICDDLRPELGCYDNTQIKSPNIDRWAAKSVQFDRAYCNIAVSGASRASLFTGLRPTKNTLSNWDARTDGDAPDAITLQEHFKSQGYTTIANGKIFHHQDEKSMQYWDDRMPPKPATPMRYLSEENLALMKTQKETGKGKRGYFYEFGEFPEEDYLDWQIAQKSINDLKTLSQSDNPFFLAVGFILPHLPFVVPKDYWDLYNHDEIRIPDNYILKEGNNIPHQALATWHELRAYSGIPETGPLDEETARMMIHGYYASVSFADAQIGRVLDALKALGLDKNTTVVLIGDHGWNLGEHGTWCKHSIMNTSLHSTMIIHSPETKKPYRSQEIVEFVDLYPTLCDAAGISIPEQTEGESLLPLLLSPNAKSKGYAVSRWDKSFTYIEDSYFYTEWRDKDEKLINRMLFDHRKDSDENYNVAEEASYQSIVEIYSEKLKDRRGKNYFR